MRRIYLGAVFVAILLLCLLGAAAAGSGDGAARMPVLMYHHLVEEGEECNNMTVTSRRFRQDMEWLIEEGYTFVLPRELASGAPLPDKPVMVTFDDGYRSNYQLLFPILKELDVKIALALVVRMVDEYMAEQYLTWDMCREMSDSGLVEFGSHTYDLHNFDQRAGSFEPGGVNGIARQRGERRTDYTLRVGGDLQKSIDVLEEELGTPVRYFAFPFGVTDRWATPFIREHFSVTVTTAAGISQPGVSLYNLNRLNVTMEHPVSEYLGAGSPWW